MLTDDITRLRTVIHEMTLTAQACRRNERFDMTCFRHACGTPACICGHAADVLGMTIRSSPLVSKRFALPQVWGRSLFLGFGALRDLKWWFHNGYLTDERCLRAFEKVIEYRRQQLATLEAEQEHRTGRNGAYTTNRKWRDVERAKHADPILAGVTEVEG